MLSTRTARDAVLDLPASVLPYCGADSGNEHIINVPLPAMTDGRGFREAVERFWMPGARVVRAADGVRLRGLRRASRRSARVSQARTTRTTAG
jgi:hypothetical protein